MEKRVRIARVIGRLNVGGPARHVVWLAEALASDEFETLLITGRVPAGEEDMASFAAEHHVNPLVIPEMSREISPLDVITIWKLYRAFVRFRPDVVHTHTAKAGTAGRLAGLAYRWLTPATLVGRPRRCRFVHTYHGHIFHSYYGRVTTRFFLAIERTLARMTDRIVVLSPQQLHEIHDVFGVGRREQFRIVPLGLDLAEMRSDPRQGAALRGELGIAPTESVVGIVGRLTMVKNHVLFLRVAAKLTRPSLRFVIYGDGIERGSLEKTAAELGLGDRVIFAGMRPATAIYASADLIALTSLNEGTPLTLIEAMANERPVISTAVGGVPDLLGEVVERRDGFEVRERGITTASNDPVAFAAGLELLLDDRALAAGLARRGKETVETKHSKERLVDDIARLTRELV